MIVRRTLLTLTMAGSCVLAHAESPGDYHLYFTEAFARHGQSVEACERLRQTRQSPSEEVISKVSEYKLQDVRVFLMYNDFKRMQNCSSDAAAELLIALGSLQNEKDLLKETRQAVDALEEILFMGTDLDFEMKYRQLPEAMRNKLEQLDYFQTPFQAYSVLDEIESP